MSCATQRVREASLRGGQLADEVGQRPVVEVAARSAPRMATLPSAAPVHTAYPVLNQGFLMARSAASAAHTGSDLRLCSPGWTRTNNPAINSRVLCQLSYRGRTALGACVAVASARLPHRDCVLFLSRDPDGMA